VNEDRNIRNSDLNLKTFIYKTVAKWYFFTLFIYANHIFQQVKQFAIWPVQSDSTPYSSHFKFKMQN